MQTVCFNLDELISLGIFGRIIFLRPWIALIISKINESWEFKFEAIMDCLIN